MVGGAVGNPFVRQLVAGVQVGHGLGRHLGVEGAFVYSPDFGDDDVKDFTRELVSRRWNSDLTIRFQQPFDHLSLAASLVLTETAHGRVDWFGGRPSRLSATALFGGGVLSMRRYAACTQWDPDDPICTGVSLEGVAIRGGDPVAKPAVALGARLDLQLSPATSLRFDLRDLAYVDARPAVDLEGEAPTGHVLGHDVLATVGVAFHAPPFGVAGWDPSPRAASALPQTRTGPRPPFDVGLSVGGVLNDPYLRRPIATSALTWHVTDTFAAELTAGFLPDLGELGHKPPAALLEEHRIHFDDTRLNGFVAGRAVFTPVEGVLWRSPCDAGRFALAYGVGFGVARTTDDLEALGCTGLPQCESTKRQYLPTTTFGPSARLWVSDDTALTLDLASLVYIETLAGFWLELKDPVSVAVGLSVALPGRAGTRDDGPAPEPKPARVVPKRGRFVQSDLGATAYLGAFGRTPEGALLEPGSSTSIGFGGDHALASQRGAVAWELAVTSGAHNGLSWLTHATCWREGSCARNPLQGPTRTFAGRLNGTATWTPHPRVGLGLRAGAGVMFAPMLLSARGAREAEAAFDRPLTVHLTPHAEGLLGPTVELHTRVPGLSVGVNADFLYTVGFDYGTSMTGFARYRLPR